MAVAMTAPNGVRVEAAEGTVDALRAIGFEVADAEPKPKAAPRKRAAKPKE